MGTRLRCRCEGLTFCPERCAPERHYLNAVESERGAIRAVRTAQYRVRELPKSRATRRLLPPATAALSAAPFQPKTEEWTVTVPNAELLTIDVLGLPAWDSTK